ncbi:hypothetical protein [Aliirhizobium smilacinae]|uniref:Peptidase M4 C-terminal domain-containing protein n=1 Tax=Aliirhizobium smilacinae TaxID=1395944 RepID=A0A5C4XH41_9HYPH|nr:hypothetical protein [Rhizobium smilacinae]TNM61864.1 hypothetical protein FHP24_21690 [Rhizobium smilacinae]
MPGQIQVWEKDPASGLLVSAPKPDVTQIPFGFSFPLPELPVDPDTTTRNFRYWNAAEALRRGADFWAVALAPKADWHCGSRISVKLSNVLSCWNAEYNRQSLIFYRGQLKPGIFLYTADSADILCHELGHAVLDTVQPPLWSLCDTEIAAFKEAFGDLSAILCALQVETIRVAILAAGAGEIFCNSRLSRIAEKFGSALYTLFPNDAEPDCLRNAYNAFCYTPPSTLPSNGPSSILTAKPHSFSRIFTGAMLEILSGMLALHPAPTPNLLRDATLDLRDIIIESVRSAPFVPQYYAALATEMVLAAGSRNPAYTAIFRGVFVRRLILAPNSPIEPPLVPLVEGQIDVAIRSEERRSSPRLISILISHYSIDQPIVVEAPADPSESRARSGVPEGGAFSPLTAQEAARTFVERLFMEGLVEFGQPEDGDIPGDDGEEDRSPSRATHRLEHIDGQLHLKRIRVQCSHCMDECRSK